MVTVPFFFAVITPLEVTVAIFLLEEVKVTFCLQVTGATVVASVSFFFTFRVTVPEIYLFVDLFSTVTEVAATSDFWTFTFT